MIAVSGKRVDASCARAENWDRYGGVVAPAENLPHYSTDMGAAWTVAEWIRARTGEFVLVWDDDFEQWGCGVGPDIEGYITADTPEHAICLAALELARREES